MKNLKNFVMICLTAFVSSSCVYNPKKLNAYFLDFDQNICAKYKIIATKPEIKFEQVGITLPIGKDCLHNGYVLMAVPIDEALEMKRAWEADQGKDRRSKK